MVHSFREVRLSLADTFTRPFESVRTTDDLRRVLRVIIAKIKRGRAALASVKSATDHLGSNKVATPIHSEKISRLEPYSGPPKVHYHQHEIRHPRGHCV
jgi:hypothetical protein